MQIDPLWLSVGLGGLAQSFLVRQNRLLPVFAGGVNFSLVDAHV